MQISCTEQCFETALAISELSSPLAQPRKWGCLKCPVPVIQCSWPTPGVSAALPSERGSEQGQLVRTDADFFTPAQV